MSLKYCFLIVLIFFLATCIAKKTEIKHIVHLRENGTFELTVTTSYDTIAINQLVDFCGFILL